MRRGLVAALAVGALVVPAAVGDGFCTFSLAFWDARHGLLATRDGGARWSALLLGRPEGSEVQAVALVGGGVGVVVLRTATAELLERTGDGGGTFTRLQRL